MQTKTQTVAEAAPFAPFKADTARTGDIGVAAGTSTDAMADIFAAEGLSEVYLVMALFAGFVLTVAGSYLLARRFARRIRE
jgi:hypothetical protein